jgi:flagellar basal body rod protein FlgB
MDLSSLIRDNIDEVLVRIIQFTHIHHNLISDNIRNCKAADFVPQYIDVEDFAKVISAALAEHQNNKRLALRDSGTVSFLPGGNFRLKPQIDIEAIRLVDSDFEAYVELQKNRLKENAINNKTACALLEHKLRKAETSAQVKTKLNYL